MLYQTKSVADILHQCCLGNIAAAEAHLSGILTTMDLFSPLTLDLETEFSLDQELTHRYLIL